MNSTFHPTFFILLFGCSPWLLSGQTKTTASVWDGVYSDEQASRGETAYRASCGSCHGSKLAGHGQNPSLAGNGFISRWDGQSVGDLFEKIQVSMPADHPGKLTATQNAEIVAYILKFNKFPAGSKDLAEIADELRSVRFEAERR